MPAFGFKDQFAPLILAGTKVQTIRLTERCKPGDVMHLFTGWRTSAVRKIAERTCVLVDWIAIDPRGLRFGDASQHPSDHNEFARLDGFKDLAEMMAWFGNQYGSSRIVLGFIHRWRSQVG